MPASLKSLAGKLARLRQDVAVSATATLSTWKPWLKRPEVLPSLTNLANYLALRRHDLRNTQLELAGWGLSSLGHCESKVLPTLDALLANLESLSGMISNTKRPTAALFNFGENHLRVESQRLLGPARSNRQARIVATMSSESASDEAWMADLMRKGMDIARINLAHDDQDTWEKMLHGLLAAKKKTGLKCRVLMDLGGPKLRTGTVTPLTRRGKVHTGDQIWLSAHAKPSGNPTEVAFWVQCTLPEAIKALVPGARVYLDDGTLACTVKKTVAMGALLEVDRADMDGKKLKPDKGINMPDTPLAIHALTKKDHESLPFALKHAHLLGFSFVQIPADITSLHSAMNELGYPPMQGPFLVLKIETALAVRNFPTLCVAASGCAPAGVMIARGDLAVEIGFLRLAEMQEELLWLSEAAHLPAIWATQVLESLAKRGLPSRAEITDAAMAVRAAGVMLNKGPYLVEAVATLDKLLMNMQAHQSHKTPLLRALLSWKDL